MAIAMPIYQIVIGVAILAERCAVILYDRYIGTNTAYVQVKCFWPLTIAETALVSLCFVPHWMPLLAYAIPAIVACGLGWWWLIDFGREPLFGGEAAAKRTRKFGRSEPSVLLFRVFRIMDLLWAAILLAKLLPDG